MCLIVHREEDQNDIPKEFFKDVWIKNDDGWGILWRKKNPDGTLSVRSKKGLKFNDFWGLYRSLESQNIEVLVHMRMRTHGPINVDMCHPFKLAEDVYVMHNGTIDHPYKARTGESDTAAFINQVLIPALSATHLEASEFLEEEWFEFLLEELMGYGNKLAFMTPEKTILYNSNLWTETDFGVNCSNTYAYNYGNPTKKAITTPSYGRTTYGRTTYGNNYYCNNNAYSRNTIGYNGSSYGYGQSKNPPSVIKKEEEGDDDVVVEADFSSTESNVAEDAVRESPNGASYVLEEEDDNEGVEDPDDVYDYMGYNYYENEEFDEDEMDFIIYHLRAYPDDLEHIGYDLQLKITKKLLGDQ